MASKSARFLQEIQLRRSHYQLAKTPALLSDDELHTLVQTVLKHSPSSFNSQTSRAVLLLGPDHTHFWSQLVADAMRAKVSDPAQLERRLGRLGGFEKAAGTVLFFEAQGAVEGLKQRTPQYADQFDQLSDHASGMAQIHLWTALSLEGYGANLQHYVEATEPVLAKYHLPSDWKLHAQLVFGVPSGELKVKDFLPDEERVRKFGSSSA
ncbi:type II nitroreductase [Tilletia horrida]|nr:type II nitroreductase [Tilletia horrida]KAK0558703.1 type II nitroreductase [Tilletia horrida]